MRLRDSLRFRIATFFRRSELNSEMDAELGSHIQLRADDLERSGLTHAEAVHRARIEFGGYERFKEECRESAGVHFLETVLQDLRFAFRVSRKSPGFAAIAVLTLALGIAANAVVFSVLNAFILRPTLNVPRPKDLYELEMPGRAFAMSYPDYLDYRDRNRSFTDLAMTDYYVAAMDTGGDPFRVWAVRVSGNYFDVLGLRPFLGRFFHRSDERGPNSAPYVVLGYSFWHSHFNDDRGVVGRTVQLGKHPFTIIGVAPPGFRGTWLVFEAPMFIPMINQEQVDGASVLNDRSDLYLDFVFGRLKKGVTPAEAAGDLNLIGSYLKKAYPKDKRPSTMSLEQLGLGGWFGPSIRSSLAGLMFLAGLILLAVCANLGSLFASRAADRSREVALRLSLGAGHLRVLRQLFTEAVLISLAGGAVGLWGAVVILRWLSGWQPMPFGPISFNVNPDASVYGVALLLALASGFLFGAVPVKQVLRTSPYEVIKAGPSSRAGGRFTVRDLMLGTQVAICAVLVVASMVAVRGLSRSLHANLGIEPRNTLLVETGLKLAGYRDSQVPAMQKRMLDAMESIPGVPSTGLVGPLPPIEGGNYRSIVFSDKTADLRPSNAAADPVTYSISPEYFRAAGTVLLSGRAFTWHDDQNAPRVAVVNPEFAGKLFGSADKALGGYYKIPDGTRIQVVGIVEEGKYGLDLAEAPQPAMFLPILQLPSKEAFLVLRSSRDPQQLSAAIRAKLRELDPGLPSFIRTWNTDLGVALFGSRMAAISLGVLGVIGVLLSITGVFGLAAYSVSKRLRELGIRMALGAQRKEVLETALGRAFKLLAFGSGAGVLLGILARRVLALIVYQANPLDPLVLTGAVLAMSLVGLLATWIPARRALSIEPSMLMREE
jgi:predicted permease